MSNYNLNFTKQQTQQLQNVLILRDKYELNLKYLKDDLEQLIMLLEDQGEDGGEDDDESVKIIDGKMTCIEDDVVRTIREEYLEAVMGRIGECEEVRTFVDEKLLISAKIDENNQNQPQYQQQLQSPTNTNTYHQHQQICSIVQFQDDECSIDQKIDIDLGCLTHENRDIDIEFQPHLPPSLSSKFYNNDEQFSSLC